MRRHPRRAGGGLERASGERAGWGGCAAERATPRPLPPAWGVPFLRAPCPGPDPLARPASAPRGGARPWPRPPPPRRSPFPARRRRPRPTSRSRHCFSGAGSLGPRLSGGAGRRGSRSPWSRSAGSLVSVLVGRARGFSRGLRAWRGLDLPAGWPASQFGGVRHFLESSQVAPKDVWGQSVPCLFPGAPEALQGDVPTWAC